MPNLFRPLFASTIVLTLGRRLLPGRRALALLLSLLLYAQAIVPPSFASSYSSVRGGAKAGGRIVSPDAAKSLSRAALVSPALETFGVVLTAPDTAFNNHAGIDYHEQSRNLIVSANSPSGQPGNFELIDDGGAHHAFSNISGLAGALKIATARDDGQGASLGGFRKGEMFTGTGAPGVVARVAPDGGAVRNPWVTLAGETGLPAGLHVDRTGVFGGDLVVVTDAGGVWRINAAGVAAPVASLGTPLSSVTTIPHDAARYGPWAGKILAGAGEQGAVYAVDTLGGAVSYPLGINPSEIELVPAHENFFGLDPVAGKLWGARADAFTSLIGDVLVAQESPGVLARIRWNGTEFETGQIAHVAAWGQITFAPAGVAGIRGVKQVYDKLAVVRHAPVLNSGRVEGALWQLNAENVALGGTDAITSDLLVPGSPTLMVDGGHPTFAGVIEGVEDAQPTGYTVSIGANASLRHLITRTNPIELESVAAPPSPAGTRDVSISKEGEGVGDFSTLRDLSLSGKAGAVSVPPGTYGGFSLSGRTTLVLGVENATEPALYNLQSLTLTGGSELRLAGPVAITVKSGVSLTGSTVGAADAPRRMLLKVAGGEVKVGGNGVLYGVVRAPQSHVEVSGRGRLRGTVMCDRLTVSGNGVIQVTENDITPPPINRPPTADAGADQTITLPSNTVSLMGVVTDDALPHGGTLTTLWTKASGPGAVAFADPANAITTATFAEPGLYTLRLRASDSLLTSDDEMTVEVVPRNQPPTVDAGTDQTIELPNTTTLNGVVSDDALPRGSTLSTSWSALSGPGAVTFGTPDRALTTATFSAAGTYVLRLTASDTEQVVADDVTVTALPKPNRPPQITSAPVVEFTPVPAGNDNGAQQGTYAYDVEASDPDGDALLAYSLDAAPTGMTIDPATGLISWPVTPREAGEHNVVVRVEDPGGASGTQSYKLTIIDPNKGAGFKVYTLNADFDQGSYINVTHAVADQLQLDETARTLNFIWVAVSSKGTVVKINTETGAVLGEYFTSPNGQARNPSRTTVDQNGNVWATNRDGNSVVHIGLVENGQCVDRNNNGVIDTSNGYGDIRPWPNPAYVDSPGGVTTAQDECVIHYTKVNSYGTRHVSVNKDNDIWVSGTGGQRFDLIDGKTGLIKRSELSVGYGGYGGLIDKNGVIWSARNLLRWDTSKPLTGVNGGNWKGYSHDSYGLCIDSKGNVWNTSIFNNQIHKFAPDGTHLGTFQHGSFYAQGCVVDKNDDVWVAHSLYDTSVGHVKNNGTFVGNVSVGSGPTGVAVDANGKIWSTNHNSWTVSRIDPNLGPIGADGVTRVGQVDLTTRELGGYLYNYSDMTGSTLSGAPDQGTWSTIFDSQTAGAQWGRIGWTAKVCGDGLLTVSVASSEDGTNFSQPLIVSNGDDPDMPAGRYLRATVKFERASSGESPVLYDLSIGTVGFEMETPLNRAPDVDAGADQTIEGVLKTTLRGTACDDGLPGNRKLALSWSKTSGPGTVAFTRPNSAATEVTFGIPGTYELKLTAADSASTRSDTIIIEVVPGNQPPAVNAGTDQAVTHPNAAALNGTVADDGLPRGGTLLVTWSKVSGPGGVAFTNPNAASNTARFGAPGTYVLRLTASDSDAASHDDVTIIVSGENQPPTVNAGPDRIITLPNTASLDGTATDDGWPESVPLAVSWSKVSGPGTVNFNNRNRAATSASFGEPGDYVLRLSASDSLLSASDEVSVTVNPAVPPPVVSINGLPDGAEVTGRINVSGTVSGGSNWRLEYTPGDGGQSANWTALASGNTAVTGGLLGVFDPTLLLNGTYTLRLVATDPAEQTNTASVSLIVDGQQKIGNFGISFTDLNVPVAGLPIQIVRTYDSRDKRVGDFGIGWTLGVKNIRVEESGILGADWEQTQSGGFLPTYCLQPTRPRFVTVTFPTGRVYKFRVATSPQCSVLTPIQSAAMSFTPLPGTHGSLLALDDNDTLVFGDAPGPVELRSFGNLEPYNPSLYRFTSEDGTVFIIDQTLGVRSVIDTNGNTLTVNADGVTHSSGKSIAFARDAGGRITRITDPNGNATTYAYDASGDLIGSTDREGKVTSFSYNSSHDLLAITDPRGIRLLNNQYDAGRRLISHTDASGGVVNYSRDPANRVEIVIDRLGNATRMEYDVRGNVVRSVDAAGAVRSFTFDAGDQVLSQTDAAGKTTFFTYDGSGNQTSVTDPLGNVTRMTYNHLGQVLTLTNPLGHVSVNTYDGAGNRLSTKDPLGNETRFTYSASEGLLTSKTDALGNTTRYEYEAGRLVKVTDASANATTLTYDAYGNNTSYTVRRTAPGGVVEALTTHTEFNRLGQPVKVTYPDGSTELTVYDRGGKPAATVDQLGRSTTYDYDEAGRLTRTTRPDGTFESSVYDAEGRCTKSIDHAGRATLYDYDAVGRLTKTTHPDGSTTTAYDGNGLVTATTDALGRVKRFEYDANNRRTKVVDALGAVKTFSYDVAGNQLSVKNATDRLTRYEYDANNRRTKTIFHDGTSSSVAYDALARVRQQTDQAGRVTEYEYDALNRILKITDALGQTTSYGYDEVGNLVSQTDAKNRTTSYEYDRLGQRTRRTLPLGMSETYAYDAGGLLKTKTDFRGKAITYDYDNMGRMLSRTPDPGLGEPVIRYTYNGSGQRATMIDGTGTTSYTYDTRDRLIGKASPQGTLTYTYNAASNLLSVTSSNAGGVSVGYGYDALNRLASVTDRRLAAGETTYAYSAAGKLDSALSPNGVKSEYAYDAVNRLTGVTVSKAETLASYAYTPAPAGNRLSVTELNGRTVNYTYDAAYRLTGETVSNAPNASRNGAVSYTYDDVGNRLARTSTLPGITSQSFSYDDNDRLAGRTYDDSGNTTTDQNSSYDYDSDGRLISADGGAVRFTYDGDGHRVSKTVNGVTTHYLVDTNNRTGYAQVVEEIVGGNVQRAYTYGHDLISQRQLVGGVWVNSFYGYDGHGSVRFLTDGAGTITDTYDYDAFGNLIASTGSTPNDYLYAGERLDPDLGLYYLRARYLHTDSGRFWTMDSFEGNTSDPRSLHKYVYANDDPVNNVDPSGNSTMSLDESVATLALIGLVATMAAFTLKVGTSRATATLPSYYFRDSDSDSSSAPEPETGGAPLPLPVPLPTWTQQQDEDEDKDETWYRAMSKKEYAGIVKMNGRLTIKQGKSRESFVTQDLHYVIHRCLYYNPRDYPIIVRFKLMQGTQLALLTRAGFHNSTGLNKVWPAPSGNPSLVHIKLEDGAINYGLRSGSVNIFNAGIKSYIKIADNGEMLPGYY